MIQLRFGSNHISFFKKTNDATKRATFPSEGVGDTGSRRRSQEPGGSQELGRAHPGTGGRQPAGSLLSAQSYQANPQDPQTVYGLAFAYMELGGIEQSQKHFHMVLDMPAPEELLALARNGLRSLPGRTFSALELLCIMYAGFKRIEPGIDIGVDLGEEWEMAERLGRETEEE